MGVGFAYDARTLRFIGSNHQKSHWNGLGSHRRARLSLPSPQAQWTKDAGNHIKTKVSIPLQNGINTF